MRLQYNVYYFPASPGSGGVERVAVPVPVDVVGIDGTGDDEAGVVVVVVIAVAAGVAVGGEGGVDGVGGVVEVAAAAAAVVVVVVVVVATRCWGGTSEDGRGVGEVGRVHRVLRGKSARCTGIFRAGKTDRRKVGGC